MHKCWANDFGNCSNKMSLEHYVSKGVFDGTMVQVQGGEWCLDKPKIVGLSSLGAKILCTKHNNQLGEFIDYEGVKLLNFLKNKDTFSNCEELFVDGYLIERWLLKTAINLNINSNNILGVGMNHENLSKVPNYLQHVAFGKLNFAYGMGLYVLPSHTECGVENSFFTTFPVVKNNEIGGIYFNLCGLGLFLSLYPGEYPVPALKEIGIEENLIIPFDHLTVIPLYRCKSMEIEWNSQVKILNFNWK